jgi:hypothetical protein
MQSKKNKTLLFKVLANIVPVSLVLMTIIATATYRLYIYCSKMIKSKPYMLITVITFRIWNVASQKLEFFQEINEGGTILRSSLRIQYQ